MGYHNQKAIDFIAIELHTDFTFEISEYLLNAKLHAGHAC